MLAALLLLAPAAHAGPTVSVRVEGQSATLLERTTVALGDGTAFERFLLAQPGVHEVRVEAPSATFDFEGDDEALAALLARAVAAGMRVVELRAEETDLEDIFLRTTQGRLQ